MKKAYYSRASDNLLGAVLVAQEMSQSLPSSGWNVTIGILANHNSYN